MVLLAVIAAASAYFLSSRQTPIYRSTQLVLIQPSRNDLGLTEATTRLMESYVVYLNSSDRAQEVINTLNLDMLARDLQSKATIAANRNNLTVQIDIDLPDGELANDVARTWGNLLVQYRTAENQTVRQEDRIDALLPDGARYRLLQPNILINTLAGAIIGFLLGGILVFVLEYLESSVVRRREDIERQLDLPVLASIPHSDR
jgi:capsular polysaccharide biosynthesis protein